MFLCTRNFQFWPFYGLLLVFRPITETRLECASKHISSREIIMSCNNSEDLQRRIQLFSSDTNQKCLLAWRTLLQWILPTLPPASLPSGFKGVAASPQPSQMSLIPPKQAVACHGVLFKGQKMVSASRQVLEWRSSLLFQLCAAI